MKDREKIVSHINKYFDTERDADKAVALLQYVLGVCGEQRILIMQHEGLIKIEDLTENE